jgi:hypothetical protein
MAYEISTPYTQLLAGIWATIESGHDDTLDIVGPTPPMYSVEIDGPTWENVESTFCAFSPELKTKIPKTKILFKKLFAIIYYILIRKFTSTFHTHSAIDVPKCQKELFYSFNYIL